MNLNSKNTLTVYKIYKAFISVRLFVHNLPTEKYYIYGFKK